MLTIQYIFRFRKVLKHVMCLISYDDDDDDSMANLKLSSFLQAYYSFRISVPLQNPKVRAKTSHYMS